jgi:hypothetical protein
MLTARDARHSRGVGTPIRRPPLECAGAAPERLRQSRRPSPLASRRSHGSRSASAHRLGHRLIAALATRRPQGVSSDQQAANRPRADGKGLRAQSHLLDEDARRHVREKVPRCSLESIASDAILVWPSAARRGERRQRVLEPRRRESAGRAQGACPAACCASRKASLSRDARVHAREHTAQGAATTRR